MWTDTGDLCGPCNEGMGTYTDALCGVWSEGMGTGTEALCGPWSKGMGTGTDALCGPRSEGMGPGTADVFEVTAAVAHVQVDNPLYWRLCLFRQGAAVVTGVAIWMIVAYVGLIRWA